MIEQVLEDMAVATDLRAIILRYFNPIGSDPDLESGIYAKEPSHVLGQLVMAARGQRDAFTITGTELPDPGRHRDPRLPPRLGPGPGARARGRAVRRGARRRSGSPSVVINVGTGDGVTVRELVAAFERVFGRAVPIAEAPPRPGDAVGAFANVDRAHELLDWRTELTLDEAHRLGAGLGRQAARGAGVRVSLPPVRRPRRRARRCGDARRCRAGRRDP